MLSIHVSEQQLSLWLSIQTCGELPETEYLEKLLQPHLAETDEVEKEGGVDPS